MVGEALAVDLKRINTGGRYLLFYRCKNTGFAQFAREWFFGFGNLVGRQAVDPGSFLVVEKIELLIMVQAKGDNP